MARAFGWFVAGMAFLFAAAYAVGGRGFIRRMLQFRSRTVAQIQESLQPPSPAEISAARVRDTASQMPSDLPPSASPTLIIIAVLTILAAAVAAFYLSGRRRRRRAR